MSEWARLPGGRILVAGPSRAWLHRPGALGDPFAREAPEGPGEIAEVARLLAAAIALGRRAAPAGPPAPPLSPPRWAWRLAGLYHLTTHTPRLMTQSARAFERAGRPELAAWAATRAREEAGHDRLALRDLAALGLDGPAVVARICPPMAGRLLRIFERAAGDALPLRVVAYAHTVEHLATRVGPASLAAVRAALPPGVDATRCLRVHSAVGADADHVRENARVVAALPGVERALIARACYGVARRAAKPSRGGPPSDRALAALIGSTPARS